MGPVCSTPWQQQQQLATYYTLQNCIPKLILTSLFSRNTDTWGLPGGHLEFGESFETCGERELLEETGLKVRDLQFWTATNSVFRDVTPNRHYVTIFIGGAVSDEGAQPQVSNIPT